MLAEVLSINEVKSKINAWRLTKPGKGKHMPKALWAAAAQLAQRHGVAAIAKRLLLHPSKLRQHTSNTIRASARRGAALKTNAGSAPVRVIEVAPIQIADADNLRRNVQLANPTAVLKVPNGINLTLFQHLDAEVIGALIRAATEALVCSR